MHWGAAIHRCLPSCQPDPQYDAVKFVLEQVETPSENRALGLMDLKQSIVAARMKATELIGAATLSS